MRVFLFLAPHPTPPNPPKGGLVLVFNLNYLCLSTNPTLAGAGGQHFRELSLLGRGQ